MVSEHMNHARNFLKKGARIPRRRRGQPGTCSKYLDSDPARLLLNEHFAS
jgi:hypothetical protein